MEYEIILLVKIKKGRTETIHNPIGISMSVL